MDFLRQGGMLWLVLTAAALAAQGLVAADSQDGRSQVQPAKAEQLFALANQARASEGLGALTWDPALAKAALRHCERMAAEGPIAHRYGGEPDVTTRAGQAGAHFSLIEENIAVGSYPATIHQGWMNSPEHRTDLLNPSVDRVGVAVVARGGVIYAVADYARFAQAMTQVQVEEKFAAMLKARGVQVLKSRASQAEAYCASTGKFKGGDPPNFLMRWQNPDVSQLPQPLVDRLATGDYKQAAVGSCAPQDVDASFTVYRVAVFLYAADDGMRLKPYYQP